METWLCIGDLIRCIDDLIRCIDDLFRCIGDLMPPLSRQFCSGLQSPDCTNHRTSGTNQNKEMFVHDAQKQTAQTSCELLVHSDVTHWWNQTVTHTRFNGTWWILVVYSVWKVFMTERVVRFKMSCFHDAWWNISPWHSLSWLFPRLYFV